MQIRYALDGLRITGGKEEMRRLKACMPSSAYRVDNGSIVLLDLSYAGVHPQLAQAAEDYRHQLTLWDIPAETKTVVVETFDDLDSLLRRAVDAVEYAAVDLPAAQRELRKILKVQLPKTIEAVRNGSA